jgi:hypothetical protein
MSKIIYIEKHRGIWIVVTPEELDEYKLRRSRTVFWREFTKDSAEHTLFVLKNADIIRDYKGSIVP